MMRIHTNTVREIGARSQMLYGHFIEHFHRQIYGGVYGPGSPLSIPLTKCAGFSPL